MCKSVRVISLLLVAGLLLAACGGGGQPPTFTVMFDAPGGSGFADGQANGLPFAPVVDQDFTFAMGIAVTGQVTDSTGTPLNNVEVSFRPPASASDVDSATTAGAGNYAVTLSAGGWVAVLKSNGATVTVTGLSVIGPGTVVLDLVFPATVVVSGSVFDSLGLGIDNAEVKFTGMKTGAEVTVTGDATGFYTADLVPDTYDAVVTPAGPAAGTHLKRRYTIVVAGLMTQNFTLDVGVLVTGTVFTNLGQTQDNTDVKVILAASSVFFAPVEVTTSAAGTFSIGPVPLGSVTFELEAPGDSSFPVQRFARQISGPTNEVEDFTLAVGFVLSGTILQDDGLTPEDNVEVKPLPTNISLPPDDDDTNGSGVFQISLFPGTYVVHITPDTGNLQLPEIRTITITGPTTLNITLQRGVMLSGTVLGTDGITPAPEIRVEIPNAIGASDVTDGAGAYSFLAPPGIHTVTLVADDGPFKGIRLDSTGVFIALPDPATLNVTLTLSTSGSTVVQGTVFAPDGITPVPGVAVEARDAADDMIGRTFADAAGNYILVVR